MSARYSGVCGSCGYHHVRTLRYPVAPHPDDDFHAVDCANPLCDVRNEALLTRVPDDDEEQAA